MNISQFGIALLFALVAAAGSGRPARADMNPAWPTECQSSQTVLPGSWQWVVNFNTSPPASCIVWVGTDGVATFEINPCVATGTVPVAAGIATFAVGNYLQCTFNPPGDGTKPQDEFDIFARTKVTNTDVATTGNPVLYHANMGLNLPWAGSVARVSMSSVLNGVRRTTIAASVPGWHGYRTLIGSGVRIHGVNGAKVSSWSQGSFSLNYNPATVYVGRDPVTGKFFGGEIDEIIVDPQIKPGCC